MENFENKPKSNLDETETVNLGDSETIKETRVRIHRSPSKKEEYVRFLKEYEDIFAWSYDNMTSFSTSIVAHKLPTNPMFHRMLKKYAAIGWTEECQKVFDKIKEYLSKPPVLVPPET
uniref:Uncharacterized protein LOC104244250 n=1 Tax=Nicotiana sylvestris TaxID=4096 RepID=A0A1U7Y196_NICSY|nr:PREDICTED: uncharacterized protein LOC104244250 [Nicotiana sylvestris]